MSGVSRRNLFKTVFELSKTRTSERAGLEEYKEPLKRNEVSHLLKRCTFSSTPRVIDKYVGKTASEIVDILFSNAKTSPTPPGFTNDILYNPNSLSGSKKEEEEKKFNKHRGDYNWALGEWWVKLMKDDQESILEKMTLFWHGHLTTQYAGCDSIPAIPMYLQNDLFRKNFAGNFTNLLQKVTVDGAMLVYLNGNQNNSEAPNENFARELMELYALGVGNYTETDVKEAAKILTGWKVKYFKDESMTPNVGFLDVNAFDKNSKKFFDEIFTVEYAITQENVYNNSVKKLINTILSKKGSVAANFIMGKLYKYFVYANPDEQDTKIINSLATQLINEKFEFTPVLKTLLKSKHFFDPQNIGIQLKSPAETIIGIVSHFKYPDLYARNVMSALGLELFNPPNVSGWKGYHKWVSTKSLPTTIFYLHEVLSFSNSTEFANWAENIENSNDLTKLVTRILEIFFGKLPNTTRLKEFTNLLADSNEAWGMLKSDKNIAGKRVKTLIEKIIQSPEFYLF